MIWPIKTNFSYFIFIKKINQKYFEKLLAKFCSSIKSSKRNGNKRDLIEMGKGVSTIDLAF